MVKRMLLIFVVFFMTISFTYAQTGVAVGKVVDNNNQPMIGANVVVKGTTVGTITDVDGNFKLTGIPLGEQTLAASFIGFSVKEKSVVIESDEELTLNFEIIEDVTTIEELVVIGYGVQKKEDKTGAVAQITAGEMNGGAVTDPLQAIAGKAAGVVVTKGGGNPTDDAKVKIRGSAGISGKTNTSPLYVIDGIPGADPNMVAPGDIESYNILKDAASTAIYGSQGANGVILITTKSGKDGVSNVNFSSVASVDMVARKIDLLSADEYRDVAKAYSKNTDFVDGGENTDWQDEIFRLAFSQQYSLSASGGNAKSTYYGSISHQDNQGIIEESDRKRTMAALNISHNALNDKLVLKGGLNVAFEKDNLIDLGKNSEKDILYQTYRRNPTDLAYGDDGKASYAVPNSTRGFDYVNPLGVLFDVDRLDTKKKIMTNASANYEVFEGLSFKVAGSYLSSDKEYNGFRPAGIYGGQGDDTGEGSRYFEVSSQKNIETTLNYTKTINELHNVTALLGYSWQQNDFRKFGVKARNSQSASVGTDNLQSFIDLKYKDAESEANMARLIGFFGRVAYNYNSKYYAGVSLRTDGSSKFGKDNQWGFFPTVSLGWNIHKESFLENTDWLSQLKLRASYGVSGNQSFGAYNSRTVLNPSSVVIDPNIGKKALTWSASQNTNPDLKWEQTAELNGGVDFGLFNSRLTGSLEVYSKVTTDMLNEYSVPSPPNVYTKTWANSGSMTNTGIEFYVTGHVVDKTNFSWISTIGFSKNISKITSLGDRWSTNDSRQGWISGQGIVGEDNYTMFIEEGEPIGNFYLYKFGGIQKGKAVYANLHKDDPSEPDYVSDTKLTQEDRYIAGNATPKIELSCSNSIKLYEQWSIDFSIRSLLGQDVYNHTNAYFSSPIFFPYANVTRDAVAYKGQGFNGQFTVPSDEFLEKASFVRLDYLAVGYTFKLKSTDYIKSLKLSVMANNLLVITGYSGADPEMSIDGLGYGVDSFGVYPKSRTFSFGVNATF